MKVIYECEYCFRRFCDSVSCEEHENDCVKNPTKKTCLTCKHFKSIYGCGEYYDECTAGHSVEFMEKVIHLHNTINCKSWENR